MSTFDVVTIFDVISQRLVSHDKVFFKWSGNWM